MTEMVTLFLPIIWAIVATGIGVVLYKTSGALYEEKRGGKSRDARRIRLTGSVVIAALAFAGMLYATPASRLRNAADNGVVLTRGALRDIHQRATQIDSRLLKLQACVATLVDDPCRELVSQLKLDSAELVELLAEPVKSGTPSQ